MELSKLQKKIIDESIGRSVVIASAASGKTAVLTEKVRQILRSGVNPKDVAVITFTNMAAGELQSRLGDDYKEGLFIGTIHSLANYYLSRAGIVTKKVISDEKFDELFNMVRMNPQCIRRLEWVLLDEAQDSDREQFEFLFNMINPTNFFVCADPKQSIYQWKGSDPSLVQRLSRVNGVKVFELNENYRNKSNILTFAKTLIVPTGLSDNSIAMHMGGSVTQSNFTTTFLVDKISKDTNFKEWAVLTRTNAELMKFAKAFEYAGIPYDTFKQSDLTKKELTKKMNSNTVKILTVHSAKGLEWNNVAVFGMRYYSNEERNVCYVAATRARENLYWNEGKKKRGY